MENINKSTYLSFAIFNEMFTIPVTNVLEVLQKIKISKVPNAPKHVKGVLNFRGEIVPVYETRSKFGFPEREDDQNSVIIILQIDGDDGQRIVGAIADSVKDVIAIAETDIKPVPQMSEEFNSEYLDGIARIKDKFMMLLNVQKVFANAETINIKIETK